MSGLFYLLVLGFVWCPPFRNAVFPTDPFVRMSAEFLNDLIWLPIAAALPFRVARLLHRFSAEKSFQQLAPVIFWLCWVLITAIVGLFRPLPLLAALFFFLWGSMLRRRQSRPDHFTFALAVVVVLVHYGRQWVPPLPRNQPSLKVMSFNINTMHPVYNEERTVRLLYEHCPDVVFLQECRRIQMKQLVARLKDLYPHQCGPGRFRGQGDVLILSRLPLTTMPPIILNGDGRKYGRLVLHAVVQIDGRPVHLLNCHLTHSGKALANFVARPSAETRKALAGAEQLRLNEGQQLLEAVAAVEEPVILAGDFNEPLNGRTVHRLSRHLQNAFSTAGWGLGLTFGRGSLQAHLPPFLRNSAFDFLRIDHIFCSHHFRVLDARVLSVGVVEHQPQTARLALRK